MIIYHVDLCTLFSECPHTVFSTLVSRSQCGAWLKLLSCGYSLVLPENTINQITHIHWVPHAYNEFGYNEHNSLHQNHRPQS